MKLRKNRKVERAAVNAVMAFFESCGCVFQEVDGANDYGKDAYVDLGAVDQVTGACIALQIKGGRSYRDSAGLFIPVDERHAAIWRTSTLPVAGLVHDAESGDIFWGNISKFLTSPAMQFPTKFRIDPGNRLSGNSLPATFAAEFSLPAIEARIGHGLLKLV